MLAFKSSPNYESPVSASVGTLADRNVYNVIVQASGGSEEVTVTVTNVDEDGSVGFIGLGRYQPQVGRSLEATLSDQDGGLTDEVWQWARSMDMGTWTDIDGATTAKRTPVAADDGYYLRASVTYTDMFGSGKGVSGVTANAVEDRTVSNSAPLFNDQDDDDATEGIQVNRDVDENTAVGVNIGSPVSASDADNDVLVYELVDTDDLKDDNTARFTINRASGQIKVGKKLGADTGQPEDETTNLDALSDGAAAIQNDATNNEYVVRVKATDPSGATRTVNVVIKVNDINEPPAFVDSDVPTVLNVEENGIQLRVGATGGDDLEDDAYDADDQDADANTDEGDATLTLSGADAKYFTITNGGLLAFVPNDGDTDDVDEGHTPNFEKQSSYSITIVAMSGEDDRVRRARLDVTVHVIDAEDDGTVSLTAREPQVGRTVVATVSDPDGGVTLNRWTWSTQAATPGVGDAPPTCPDADAGTWVNVDPDVSSGAYTPKSGDADSCLRATATYTDNIEGDGNDVDTDGNMEMVSKVSEKPVQMSDPANTAPEFPDQDLTTIGDQSDTVMRSVEENMADETVGGPIAATDTDGDAMLYTLSGDDSASFKVDNAGQIRTKVKLDFETKDEYMVALTATDPSGANDSILVTIMVTDGPDTAMITGSTAVDYAENGTGPVAAFSATDQDGDDIVWSLGGDDKGDFTIAGGVLAFKSSPNYESPVSASVGTLADRNVYNVTVEATGGTHNVVVTVTNVDEDGSVGFIGLGRYQPQVGRSLEATLSDQDGGLTDEVWQWARSMDMQTWMDIEGATTAKRTPMPADDGYYLRASVTYTDMFGSGKAVSAVTANAVEDRTLANSVPLFNDQDDDDATEGIQVNRDVDENTAVGVNIGSPVSASDADNDVLVYDLVDTDDLKDGENKARFTITRSSGQIKVGKKLGADTGQPEDEDTTLGEAADGAAAIQNDATNNEYVVRVKATDPSGATRTVNVVIKVNDINEPPAFVDSDVPTVLNVIEKGTTLRVGATGGDDLTGTTAYDANDQDADQDLGVGKTAAENETDAALTLSGSDAKYFEITDPGELTFVVDVGDTDADEGHTPNFEKQSSYAITIVASSGEEDRVLRARLDVTVHVIDAEDDGTVSLTAREPQVGRTVVATVSDPDGGVALTRWTWAIAAEPTGLNETCANAQVDDFTNVTPDVTSGAYTPKSGDAGMCLRATATYKDNIGDDEATPSKISEKPVQMSDPANTAPEFPDQDLGTEGDQSDTTMRSVAENMADETVGNPVYADDTDGDALLYTLSGDDSASFKVDNNGQIRTKVKLDFETKDEYMVALTASDPSGATDSILVMVTVIDGPDPAEITTGPAANTAPAFDSETAELMVYENMDAGAVGDPVAATDEDDDDLTYQLTGGGDYFDIDSASGQITTTMSLDHEMMASHMVTVTASDDEDTATIAVTITVGNVVECEDAGAVAVDDRTNTGLMADCEALLASRDTLMGADSTRMLNWSIDTPIADWYGVRKLSGSGRVEWLYLHGISAKDATDDDAARDEVKLNGTIPAELGKLDALTRLYLHRNNLTGGIPAELNDLTNLVWLRLYDNQLAGTVPDLSGMTSLQRLYLHENGLTGGVPTEVSDSVTHILVHSNELSGDIPDLGGMSNLVWLGLYDNDLDGSIPASLGMLSNLQRLYLHNNALTGLVPAAIGDLGALTNLWLSGNDLSGGLPNELNNLMSLERVRIAGNNFEGCVPDALANAASTDVDAADACGGGS